MVQGERKTALLLLGHGSKVEEANQALYEIAAGVRGRREFPIVEVAFLQLAEPLLDEGLARCLAQGAERVLLIPYFLYLGAHVGSDIPHKLTEARERYPRVEIVQGSHLGVHPQLVEVVLDRIAQAEGNGGAPVFEQEGRGAEGQRRNYPSTPAPLEGRGEVGKGQEIEERSYEIIRSRMEGHVRAPGELAVVMRAIHATADFGWERELLFHPQAIGRGLEALWRGKFLVADVNMVGAGVRGSLLGSLGGEVRCHIADPDLAGETRPGEKATRAALGMRRARAALHGGIAVIGNAPTALEEVLRLAREEGVSPALVIGVPVGLVGATEAKEALLRSDIPYITNRDGKGGSPLAVSITNAMLKLATEAKG